jgi:hypothetical protein
MHNSKRYVALVALGAIIMLALDASDRTRATSSYFYSRCASCHSDDTPTCAGCHYHRGTLHAQADKASYYPQDPVIVTLGHYGGQPGWIRAALYDHNSIEVARASGPTGTGDDGQPDPVAFPVELHASAPPDTGDFVWTAAWYGCNDAGSVHFEVTTPVTIRVEAGAGAFDHWPPVGSTQHLALAVSPNPLTQEGTLRYALARATDHVTLEIIDPTGRLLRRLISAPAEGGIYEIGWDGRDGAGRALPAGTYMAVLSGAGERVTRPIQLLR